MTTAKKFYLVSSEYKGPNERDSSGSIMGDTREMIISTEPGRTNLSREISTEGWLGTSHDISRHAHGVFDSLEAAVQEAADLGFTEEFDDTNESCRDSWVASYISDERANYEYWDAEYWFADNPCDEYGITSETSDSELEAAAERAEKEARDDKAIVVGVLEHFTELRDELKN